MWCPELGFQQIARQPLEKYLSPAPKKLFTQTESGLRHLLSNNGSPTHTGRKINSSVCGSQACNFIGPPGGKRPDRWPESLVGVHTDLTDTATPAHCATVGHDSRTQFKRLTSCVDIVRLNNQQKKSAVAMRLFPSQRSLNRYTLNLTDRTLDKDRGKQKRPSWQTGGPRHGSPRARPVGSGRMIGVDSFLSPRQGFPTTTISFRNYPITSRQQTTCSYRVYRALHLDK